MIEFERDAVNAKMNHGKHRISFEETTSAFYDGLSVTFPDSDQSVGESRFLLIGMTTTRRFMVVAHNDRGGRVSVICARRRPAKNERLILTT